MSDTQLARLPQQNGFRLRGTEMTRLETFMDAAFAFATTMLVISGGEIPKNYPEMVLALKDIPSFIASFLIIMLFWAGHRAWSRRYGLEDRNTILISISLIFVLLVYIYPLRLMFSTLFNFLSNGWLPARFELRSHHELIGLFIIYGIGLSAMGGLMALLYWRAKAAREALKLNPMEMIKTNQEISSYLVVCLTGLASAIYAWLMPPNLDLLGGFLYVTLPVSVPLVEFYYKRKARILKTRTSQ